ncbi:transglutaminase family protein [Nocardioides sp. Kera G14]|uniref:transglutaminase family protein n=1 Tax=Nocardioides sp. Kera G14 TaxID=2884264 RepID=UPI001D106748|nr:transglutaminase family protein [Nocardioides sp. Kera G14]UDY24909.1 transglutaminase family protein [Nocardioides sp. Kera G14]
MTMSQMTLRIVHTTGFEYDGRAVASYNQARLTPLSTPEQIVVHHRVEVSPKPWTHLYRDYFGNQVTAFEVVDPHESMRVTATSTVQVNRPAAAGPSLTWGDLTDRAVSDRWVEYLVMPELVSPPEEFALRVKELNSLPTPGEAAKAICELVRSEVTYRPGSTDVQDSAAVAWEQRAGISQDMVHLAIGGLRTLGIPARYVSGYCHTGGEVGSTVSGESHAWVEWWDDGWKPFDPTNGTEPQDSYVAVATGRDYTDAKPLSGIYSGAETSSMFVEVEITRLA